MDPFERRVSLWDCVAFDGVPCMKYDTQAVKEQVRERERR